MGHRPSMKVTLQNLDEPSKSFFDARYLGVQIGSKTITTPYRALSNIELASKATIPSEIVLPAVIAGIHEDLSETAVHEILTENATIEKMKNTIENYRHRMQHSQMIFSLLQPGINARKCHLKDLSSKEKFLDLTIQIQKMANFTTICVPWVGYGSSADTIQSMKRIEKNFDDELVFFLDVTSKPQVLEEVSNYLNELIDSDRIHFIGLLYESPEKALNSYYTLWKQLKEKNVAVILANLTRANENFENLSSLHLNEFILGDIFLPKQRKFFPKKRKDGEKEVAVEQSIPINVKDKLRIFNNNQLTVTSVASSSNDLWIEKMSKSINDVKIKHILDNYYEAETDVKKFKVLSAVSKIHEFIESTNEIKKSQEFIRKNETVEYLREKNVLNKSLKKSIGVEKTYQTKLS
jgi:hypothetical protein